MEKVPFQEEAFIQQVTKKTKINGLVSAIGKDNP